MYMGPIRGSEQLDAKYGTGAGADQPESNTLQPGFGPDSDPSSTQATDVQGQPDQDISHLLRTQLAIITLLTGNLDILYERLDDDRRREMIRDIRAHTRVLNDLAISLLTHAP